MPRSDCFRILDITYKANSLSRRTHANCHFRTKCYKFKMTAQGIRNKVAAFVTTIESDFSTQQTGTNTYLYRTCEPLIAV
jgi:hypothetical protein